MTYGSFLQPGLFSIPIFNARIGVGAKMFKEKRNKLAKLQATLFRNYDLPTHLLADGGEV